jgi:hypothetical protein
VADGHKEYLSPPFGQIGLQTLSELPFLPCNGFTASEPQDRNSVLTSVKLPVSRRLIVGIAGTAALAVAAGVPASAAVAHHSARHALHRAAAMVNAPSGQTTVGNILPAAATTFGLSAAGWTPLTAPLAWVPVIGHSAPGSIAVTSNGLFTSAASPAFAATPGARYSASAWTRAALTGHAVGVGLKFYNASGSVIPAGNELSQDVTDSATSWTRTNTVVGFAPAGAVTGVVTVASMDSALGLVDYADDITVTKTTGVAARIVGPLTTSGPNVIDASGRRVVLHGIQLGGLKNPAWSDTTVTTEEVVAAQSWGANFARVPLAENPILAGDCDYDPAYLAIVDRIVSDVTSRGMVVLLDLHTNSLNGCGSYLQQKMPDAGSVKFWQFMAARYKNNPLVAFDLYNEPHDVTDSVWRNGGTVSSSGVTYTSPGMQKLYDTVRATGANNLVFASGNGWANKYPAGAPLTNTKNLVYGVHAYTCPKLTPENGGNCTPGPAGLSDPSGILGNFAAVGATVPVMITEFGYPDKNDGYYIANGADYATSHNWVGWNVFVFDGTTQSDFDLVKDAGPTWNPAQSGMSVITGMLTD